MRDVFLFHQRFSVMKLKRGVNIEGWLWHLGGSPRGELLKFTPEDARLVAELGFDHLRINVNEQSLWDDEDRPRQQSFDRVDEMLDTCASLGLNAIFDLHVVRGHHFNAKDKPLFYDPKAVDAFLDCWRRLSDWLGHRPDDMLAYEFLNEPVADNDPEDWNRVARKVHAFLREKEPERTFILGSNGWNSVDAFENLWIPDDRNLVLTFHFYRPFQVTHHAVHEKHDGMYAGAVHYPGQPVTDEELEQMGERQRELAMRDNQHYDRSVLARLMEPAIRVAKAHDLPVYCGEWGCYDTVPRADRVRWHQDMVSVLNEVADGWAVYAYRGRWGTVKTAAGEPDEELVRVLTGSGPG